MEASSGKSGPSKRGTPNKRWRAEFDNFLVPLLVEQAKKGLKCDKSFKRTAFAYAAIAVNGRFNTDFTSENVENHYRTLKARYVEIKKAKDLSGAGWDDENKIITLDPLVAAAYIEAHPAAKSFINRPIENFEGLRIICGDDNATGSYATSAYGELGEHQETDDPNADNMETGQAADGNSNENGNDNSNPPPIIPNSPTISSSARSQRSSRAQKEPSMMADLVHVVGEMVDAIKNPIQWEEKLYARVMEVEGFDVHVLEEVFDYLQEKEKEGKRFMVKSMDLRHAWIERYLSRMA